MNINSYLKVMVEKEGSDLFFTVGSLIKIKIEGEVKAISDTILTSESAKAAAYGIMREHQIAEFEKRMECDFAILSDDATRFRVNVFRQQGEVSMVLRRIPNKIPTAKELGLPAVLEQFIVQKRGLILMVGATSSGKSTTIATMINYRNENMAGHILTIEDPIEFSHPSKKSIVNQREIGIDTFSYATALKAALHEAPDVVLIGEIRDRETMESALQLSNTGHLTVSTLHANNASQAVERIINMFPQERHRQLFMDLSLNIRVVISQRLLLTDNGKRCAALEVMINTPHIAELILKGDVHKIKMAMEESGQKGMQTFDLALFNLYQKGRIDMEEALSNADSRANLEAKINFG